MVVADPQAEVLELVRALGDPAPADAPPAARRRAELARRRFGVALPPPFAGEPGSAEPVRRATASDGAAIAAVKWRAFGTSYRGGVLPDAFLDGRDIVPPASFWTGRAMVPPSRRHHLLVWGRPGTVFGYVDCGPAHPDDLDPADRPPVDRPPVDRPPADRAPVLPEVGEVYELYVDPSAQGRGGGGRLLAAATEALAAAGLARLELSVLTTNVAAQAFYVGQGWAPTGRVVHVDLGTVAFDEARFGFPAALPGAAAEAGSRS